MVRRGMVTWMIGASAHQEKSPLPLTVTWVLVTLIDGELTMNEPKYEVVRPEILNRSPLRRVVRRRPSMSTRRASLVESAMPA